MTSLERQHNSGITPEWRRNLSNIPLPKTAIFALCSQMVEVGEDPWAATTCKLRAGHEGPCSPLYPDEYR
jgi:hypothetical protein